MKPQLIIPLAAMFQSARLVSELAHHGRFDMEAATPLLSSLFQFDADSTEAVYGGLDSLRPGLKELKQQLSHADRQQIEVPHMVMAMMQLAKKLGKAETRLQQMHDQLMRIEEKLEMYELTHVNTISAIAEIYKQKVSDLSPRIMVKGDPLHLENPDNQSRVRALLLAGIRSAILWDQLGGSRFHLLFRRKALLELLQNQM
jgi:high frequency lysogenization protein